jgi:hypothetical protein
MEERFNSASKYLKVLEESFVVGWMKFHQEGLQSLYGKLALIHPGHLGELDLPKHLTKEKIQNIVQGPRAFPENSLEFNCECNLIWGYSCILETTIQKDHLFPYSLGGPTISCNKINLCKYHNMVKSSDIHCFPWEAAKQRILPWVDNQIENLHNEVFKLYG